jgi:hypothetical protein
MRKWQQTILLVTLVLLALAVLRFGTESNGRRPAQVALLPAASSGPSASSSQAGRLDNPPEPVEPSSIDLANLPADSPRAENKYDLWLRGELGEGREGLVSKEERARLQEAALLLEPDPDIQDLTLETASAGPEITTAFDGPDIDDCCGGGGGTVPPDPELAVGANHVIAVINVAFEIYNKSGASLHGPTTFATLFSGISGCTFGTTLYDPNVLYDEAADRFLLGIVGGGNYYCLAASATSDPTGVWYRYRVPTASGGDFFDYPHAGVGGDAIYMGANVFDVFGTFKESRVWAFDKWAMYAGQSTAFRLQFLPDTDDTPQPANLHGYAHGGWPSDGPHYFITEYQFNGATYSVWAWDNPFGSNNLYRSGTYNMVAETGVGAGLPPDARQPSDPFSQYTITANDWRPQDAEYRNGYIWTTDTIACNPGTGSVDCVRWAQIDPGSASVVQAGVIGSNGQFRLFGDLAVNHCNDMAIGYTRTDPNDGTSGFPGIWVAGRLAEDTPNALRQEAPLKVSNVLYTAFDGPPRRWGDYTGFTSDPNGLDVWYIGQYSKNTGNPAARWGTFIGRFRFLPEETTPPPPPPGLDHHLYLPFITDDSIC